MAVYSVLTLTHDIFSSDLARTCYSLFLCPLCHHFLSHILCLKHINCDKSSPRKVLYDKYCHTGEIKKRKRK